MRRRWALLIPPLLTGLFADLCLVVSTLRPLRRSGDYALILGVVVLSLGAGVLAEWSLWRQQRGLIELRSIRHKGTEHPAFVIPTSPHPWIGLLLICILLTGVSLALLVDAVVHSSVDLSRDPTLVSGAVGMSLGVLGVGTCLWWLLSDSRALVLLPTGVLLQWMGCFLPWELIQDVALVKVSLVAGRGPTHLSFRVTDPERVEASPKIRHRMAATDRLFGWHCFCPSAGMTLTTEQLARIVRSYFAHPEERPKIGTQAELDEVKAALASARSSTAR